MFVLIRNQQMNGDRKNKKKTEQQKDDENKYVRQLTRPVDVFPSPFPSSRLSIEEKKAIPESRSGA